MKIASTFMTFAMIALLSGCGSKSTETTDTTEFADSTNEAMADSVASDSAKELVEMSEISYKRFANIEIKGGPGFDGEGKLRLEVQIRQTAPAKNGKVLTREELNERGLAVFKDLVPEGYTVVIEPIVLAI